MTEQPYTGRDAVEELEEERREEKRKNLKEAVDDQECRIKSVEKRIEKLQDKLNTARKAKRTERKSLKELEDVSIEDFEDLDDVELARDEEGAVTVEDVGGAKFIRNREGVEDTIATVLYGQTW